MSLHDALEILKRDVGKGSSELLTRQQMEEQQRNTLSTTDTKDKILSFIDSETIRMKGEMHYIWRLYAPVGNTEGVGWILDQDIDQCMICYTPFSFFNYRHHCRSCGEIVCHSCSPSEVIIEEFAELGPQRVCHCCYWGQDPVHAGRLRKIGLEKDVSAHTRFSEINSSSKTTPVKSIKSPFVNVQLRTSPPSASSRLFERIDDPPPLTAPSSSSAGSATAAGLTPKRPSGGPNDSARKQAADEARRARVEEFERQQREEQEQQEKQQALLSKLERRVEETGAGHVTAAAPGSALTSAPTPSISRKSMTLTVVPKPGFVIKTFRVADSSVKVFINIMGHKAVGHTTLSAINKYNQQQTHPLELDGFLVFGSYNLDEDGDSIAYDVLINDTVLNQCLTVTGTETVKPIVCEAAIRWVSQTSNKELNGSYKLPKIRAGFKGLTSTPYERQVPANATPAPRGTEIVKPVVLARMESGLGRMESGLGLDQNSRPGSTELPGSRNPSGDRGSQSIRNSSLERGSMRVTEVDAELFSKFLKPGEMMVACSLVNKPNPMGLPHKRQLILTSGCRLIYVETGKMLEKGSIQWSPEKMPIVKAVSVCARKKEKTKFIYLIVLYVHMPVSVSLIDSHCSPSAILVGEYKCL